ncbi:hypothetical protein [Candidatus Arsenophonus triatominarum]|uniref:hypothetical protein n=1 Tax=Candidatus Arsenophonus triatominarum TaxID=57911 RepID=UPI000AE6E414|nr:hypothetical protein [Candidatus Arsenophonus triatominarum]
MASVIGLRISEILALDYSDIQGEYLNISKHVTRNGVIEGLKLTFSDCYRCQKGYCRYWIKQVWVT